MKVLVTGANGFLGRHVVAALRAAGHDVRALVRPAADISGLGWDDRVEIFRADLRAARNLADAFHGVDALMHLAAAVGGDDDLQFQSSVVGAERLYDAMARSSTRRLVLASSYSVYDWRRATGALTEESPLESDRLYDRDGYAVAKVWQERITRRAAEKHGWSLTVLRPGFIWGRAKPATAGVGQELGPLLLVIGPFRRLPLTHVVNCADAFVRALDDRAAGATFNVVDDPGPTAWAYAGEWSRRSGARAIRVPVPYALGYGVALLARAVSRTIYRGKGKLPSILTPRKFQARFKPLRFPNDRLMNTLGWRPPLSREERAEATYGAPATAAPAQPSPAPQPRPVSA